MTHIKHVLKFTRSKKLEPVRWHPWDDPNVEIQDWGVCIGIEYPKNHTLITPALNKRDIIRLRKFLKKVLVQMDNNEIDYEDQ